VWSGATFLFWVRTSRNLKCFFLTSVVATADKVGVLRSASLGNCKCVAVRSISRVSASASLVDRFSFLRTNFLGSSEDRIARREWCHVNLSTKSEFTEQWRKSFTDKRRARTLCGRSHSHLARQFQICGMVQ